MNYTFPLVATSRSNETRIFRDADTFLAFAHDRTNGGVGAYWLEARVNLFGKSPKLFRAQEGGLFDRWRETTRNEWIVRDDRGRVVDKLEIGRTVPWVPPKHWRDRAAERRLAAEKGLPIPYTGCRYRNNKRYSKLGRNGTYNRNKGLFLFEDTEIDRGDYDNL